MPGRLVRSAPPSAVILMEIFFEFKDRSFDHEPFQPDRRKVTLNSMQRQAYLHPPSDESNIATVSQ